MTFTTAGPPPAGINWQAVILTEFGLVLDPSIEMFQDPNAGFNLELIPEIQMLGPQYFGLQFNPRLGMKKSTIGEGSFNLEWSPSIGMNQVPDTAFNLDLSPAIGMGMVSTEGTGALTLDISPSIGMVGAGKNPPAYDNSASSAYQSGVTSGTPFTFTEDVGDNCYGIVALFGGTGSSNMTLAATAAVEFGGVTLTSLGSIYLDNIASNPWIWVFGGSGIPSGDQEVSVTLTQTGDKFYGYASSFTYSNITTVGTLQTKTSLGNTQTLSVSSGEYHIVWGAMTDSSASTTFSSFSLNDRQSLTGHSPVAIAGDTAGASSVTVSATTNTSNYYGIVALDLS